MNSKLYAIAVQSFIKPSIKYNRDYFFMGLSGEAGEVLNERKKELREGDIRTEKIIDELGDVLFYLTALASIYGEDLESLMERNINKLTERNSK